MPGRVAPPSPSRPSTFGRIRMSLRASAGDVVFGMEDGTVSIFGLVAGVAATSSDSKTVIIAGAAGAAAAAVSMGAGVFLDRQTQTAQRTAEMADLIAEAKTDPQALHRHVRDRLEGGGLTPERADQVIAAVGDDSEQIAKLAEVLDDPPPDQAGLVGHASWMFVADLFAGLVPVIPFFFLPVETARWWAIIVTVVLMVALGIGRSRVGKTPLISTVASTLGIAAAAGVVGVAIGWGLDSLV